MTTVLGPVKGVSFAEIWDEAVKAANDAATQKNQELGPEKDRGLDCGFAWLHVPDGRSGLAKWLKKHVGANKHWDKGVFVWYSNIHDVITQSISVHIAACGAAVKVYQKYGYAVKVGYRYD